VLIQAPILLSSDAVHSCMWVPTIQMKIMRSTLAYLEHRRNIFLRNIGTHSRDCKLSRLFTCDVFSDAVRSESTPKYVQASGKVVPVLN
jgi:hypothetical protein